MRWQSALVLLVAGCSGVPGPAVPSSDCAARPDAPDITADGGTMGFPQDVASSAPDAGPHTDAAPTVPLDTEAVGEPGVSPGWQGAIRFCVEAQPYDIADRSANLDLADEIEQASREWSLLSGGTLLPAEVVQIGDCPTDPEDGVSAFYLNPDLREDGIAYAPTVKRDVDGVRTIVACDIQFRDPLMFANGNQSCLREAIRHELGHCYSGTGNHRNKGIMAHAATCTAGLTPADAVFVLTEAGL